MKSLTVFDKQWFQIEAVTRFGGCRLPRNGIFLHFKNDATCTFPSRIQIIQGGFQHLLLNVVLLSSFVMQLLVFDLHCLLARVCFAVVMMGNQRMIELQPHKHTSGWMPSRRVVASHLQASVQNLLMAGFSTYFAYSEVP